jgi:glycosyltransferase involved in cell wall biosynthesis
MNQKNRKLSVTVGISAYNEAKTLPGLILSILNQKCDTYRLNEIAIICDGCTDNTAEEIQEIKSEKVNIISKPDRRGKATRINELFKIADSEILVLLDADIQIKHAYLLEKLIAPFQADDDLLCVSGSLTPLSPKNFTQKVIHAGSQLWDSVRNNADSKVDLYYCTGAIRGFRKLLYKEMIFPNISAEDVYPYLYCRLKNYKFLVVREAVAYYKIPYKYMDFFKQMSRYLKSKEVLSQYFSSKMLQTGFSITTNNKLKQLLVSFVSNPFWISTYILYLLPIHAKSLINSNQQDEPIWEVIESSKE